MHIKTIDHNTKNGNSLIYLCSNSSTTIATGHSYCHHHRFIDNQTKTSWNGLSTNSWLYITFQARVWRLGNSGNCCRHTKIYDWKSFLWIAISSICYRIQRVNLLGHAYVICITAVWMTSIICSRLIVLALVKLQIFWILAPKDQNQLCRKIPNSSSHRRIRLHYIYPHGKMAAAVCHILSSNIKKSMFYAIDLRIFSSAIQFIRSIVCYLLLQRSHRMESNLEQCETGRKLRCTRFGTSYLVQCSYYSP